MKKINKGSKDKDYKLHMHVGKYHYYFDDEAEFLDVLSTRKGIDDKDFERLKKIARLRNIRKILLGKIKVGQ